jgi:hypothetical protein
LTNWVEEGTFCLKVRDSDVQMVGVILKWRARGGQKLFDKFRTIQWLTKESNSRGELGCCIRMGRKVFQVVI